MTVYRCPDCAWRGDRPSFTDFVEDRLEAGVLVEVRSTRPVCPRCFAYVSSRSPELDPEL